MNGYIIMNMTEYAQVATACYYKFQPITIITGMLVISVSIFVFILIFAIKKIDKYKQFLKKHNLTDKFWKEQEAKK